MEFGLMAGWQLVLNRLFNLQRNMATYRGISLVRFYFSLESKLMYMY